MRSSIIISMAEEKLKAGEIFKIMDGDVKKLHQRLRKESRKRNFYDWKFGRDGNYLVIISRSVNYAL